MLEKGIIANTFIPLDSVDLSMFSEETQSELIGDAVKTLAERAKNQYNVKSAKKAVAFYQSMKNGPRKNMAKTELESVAHEDRVSEVAEVILGALGKTEQLKERAMAYLFDSTRSGYSSDDFKSALRALEYGGIKLPPEGIRKLSQAALVSNHPFAVHSWTYGYSLLNETPEIPKEGLENVLRSCDQDVFSTHREDSPALALMERITTKYQDKLLDLADLAFEKKHINSAAFLYMKHFESEKDNKSKEQLKEINKLYLKGANIEQISAICKLIEDEIPYRALHTNFRRLAFGAMGQWMLHHFNADKVIGTLLEAPTELLERLVEQEDKWLLKSNTRRLGDRASKLYEFAIRAYLKLGNQDAAKILIDQGIAMGAVSTPLLDTLKIRYAQEKAAELRQEREREHKEKYGPKEGPALDDLALKAAEEIKSAYKSNGFEGVERIVSKLAKENNLSAGIWSDAVSIYHHILEKTERRKYDGEISGTVFTAEESKAAARYCLLNNIRFGVPSRLVHKYSGDPEDGYEDHRNEIDPKIWLQAATLTLLSRDGIDTTNLEEAITFTKCAGVEPQKSLYTQLGIQRLRYSAKMPSGCEGEWSFDTTNIWSAREALKKGDRPELVEFINNNFGSHIDAK